MADDFTIREADPTDVVGIVYVQATSWVKHYATPIFGISEDDIRSVDFGAKVAGWQHVLRSPSYKVWIARDAKAVLAFVAARSDGDSGEIYEQHTLPEHQSRGLGSQLLDRALSWLGERRLVYLRIPSYAQGGVEFYQKKGFSIDEQGTVDFVRLPSGQQIPTIVMSKSVTAKVKAVPKPKAKKMVQSAANLKPKLVSRAQLAKAARLRPSTIKYYTETGLLPFVQIEARLARRYELTPALARLAEIKNLKQQGHKIEVIKENLKS